MNTILEDVSKITVTHEVRPMDAHVRRWIRLNSKGHSVRVVLDKLRLGLGTTE